MEVKSMGIGERIKSEQKAIVRSTNNDLVCKDCLVRYPDDVIYGNTSKCEEYPNCKPIPVLLGGQCEKYIKE